MKIVSNVRNIFRNVNTTITFGSATGGGYKINVAPAIQPAGAQAAQPDAIAQTWRSNPSLGTWRPLGDITETRFTNTPISWTSASNGPSKTGTSLTATVEIPEILTMAGFPTAIFFSFGINLGQASTVSHSDWNCFVNVANLFANAQLTNPGFLIRDTFAEFTGCIYGNLRKTLRDTRIAITVNGFYTNTDGEFTNRDFVNFNLTGSSLAIA